MAAPAQRGKASAGQAVAFLLTAKNILHLAGLNDKNN